MGRQLIATSVAVMVGLATAGCASMPDTQMGERVDGQTVVEVTNNHPRTVTVHAVSSGVDQRLGQVDSNRTETFRLPSSVTATDLRISVDPMGSAETYLSPQVSVADNDVITVTVESNLALSTVSLR